MSPQHWTPGRIGDSRIARSSPHLEARHSAGWTRSVGRQTGEKPLKVILSPGTASEVAQQSAQDDLHDLAFRLVETGHSGDLVVDERRGAGLREAVAEPLAAVAEHPTLPLLREDVVGIAQARVRYAMLQWRCSVALGMRMRKWASSPWAPSWRGRPGRRRGGPWRCGKRGGGRRRRRRGSGRRRAGTRGTPSRRRPRPTVPGTQTSRSSTRRH